MGLSAPTLPEAVNSPDPAGGGPQAIRKWWERGTLVITSDIHPLHPLELNISHVTFFLYFSGVSEHLASSARLWALEGTLFPPAWQSLGCQQD